MKWWVGAVAGVTVVGVVATAVIVRRSDDPGSTSIDRESIVLLGDSITAEGEWSAMFPDARVVNSGRSGFTTAQLVSVASEIAAVQPRMLLVLTGTNDIRDDRPPSWTATHLSELLDVVVAAAPDTDVVVQTVLPRADRVAEVRAVNVTIRDLAASRSVRLVDLYVEFDDGHGALRPDETSDGIHLSKAGYDRWAAILRPLFSVGP